MARIQRPKLVRSKRNETIRLSMMLEINAITFGVEKTIGPTLNALNLIGVWILKGIAPNTMITAFWSK